MEFTWKICGPAGFGIMSTGLIFSKAFSRSGYYVFNYTEYPSLIKGGHNTYQCRISTEPIHSQSRPVHILVALDAETLGRHNDELLKNSAVIYDNEKITGKVKAGVPYPIPLVKLAKESGATEIMANNVALGASIGLLDYDLEFLDSVIKDMFGKKGDAIVNENMNAAKAGYDYVKANFKKQFFVTAKKLKAKPKPVLTGNEAIGAGAIAAGMKCYVAYPMTPASSILHYIAAKSKELGIVVRHAEDEISVINTGIGVAHTGVRTMVGTAGGGFALMVEGYGLAAITETPLVIVEAQRVGPATGMPTWTGQGDLRFVMHAHQDDFPRIVIVPGDAEEAYYATADAHNIAEKYQNPVIVLTDKHLSESSMTACFDKQVKIDRGALLAKTPDNYKRYKFTKTGISPRVLVGTENALIRANSYEHDELGFTTEESDMRIKMMDKRMRKLESFSVPVPILYGPKTADITFVGFGSTKGAALDGIKMLEDKGIKANYLHFVYIMPFPKAAKAMLSKARKLVVVEGNFTAQFAGVIAENTGILIEKKLLKYDGRPFYPEEIAEFAKKVLK